MAQASGSGLRRFSLKTLLPAVLGAAGGYLYASFQLSPELMKGTYLAGMYSAMGAATGIVGVRVGVLVRSVLEDYFKKPTG